MFLLNFFNELMAYGVVGIISTALNIMLYALFSKILAIHYLASTASAFILATVFAYFGNRYFVFKSNQKAILIELILFFSMRLLMGALDFSIMYISVDLLRMNDMIMKVTANSVVIIGNYICSRFIIFKQNTVVKE
ncbi:hypothetical protein AGMMS49940_11880 [Spirochaetia bacterium]|nr:hypothetical protein AGMMS49940_11880 [Spirochaetia bacterium]